MLFSLSSSVIRSNLSFVILNHRIFNTNKKEQLINVSLETLIDEFCVCSFVWIGDYKQLTKSFQCLFYFTFHIIWLLRGSIDSNAVQSSYEDCILVARHVCVPIAMWPRHLVYMNQWKTNVDSISSWEYIHTRRCSLLSLLSMW
jgi:hypothetical protein